MKEKKKNRVDLYKKTNRVEREDDDGNILSTGNMEIESRRMDTPGDLPIK